MGQGVGFLEPVPGVPDTEVDRETESKEFVIYPCTEKRLRQLRPPPCPPFDLGPVDR